MTERELSTLVRDHVSSDEPPFALTPDQAIRRGRRVVRRRRLILGGTVAAVLAVGGLAGGPALTGGDGPDDRSTAVDRPGPDATVGDPAQLPRLLEEQSRAVLGRSVDDLGPATLETTDDALVIRFGTGSDHRFEVTLTHDRRRAEESGEQYCESGLIGGSYLECTREVRDDGSIVITKLWGVRLTSQGTFKAIKNDEIATIDRDRLWFERRVKVVSSETFVTYVKETLRAPSLETARDAMQVPEADLVELGTDPRLVLPD
ncbi:hypothetical protein [Nocardioides lijunqiniae]|uniref:hypothetical protein n=1 Tax=Nocardioides lijunqiniae TaxID=2760832 RepID=UPI001877C7E0|nr:hypothetical protein [Nocardioides lijunqiniae]